jgi:hypothetical protein
VMPVRIATPSGLILDPNLVAPVTELFGGSKRLTGSTLASRGDGVDVIKGGFRAAVFVFGVATAPGGPAVLPGAV